MSSISSSEGVVRRLGAVPEASVHLLRVASVLGSPFTVTELGMALGCPVAALMPAFEAALERGVLEERQHRVAFRHEATGQALYAELPSALRVGLHLEIGRRLARLDAPPERVAHHLLRGAHAGDLTAVRWLQEAAQCSTRHAPAVAAALFGRAADIVGPSHPQRGALLASQAANLVWVDASAASALCREGLAQAADRSAEGIFHLCLAQASFAGAQLEEARRAAGSAAASPGLSIGQRAQAAAWASLATASLGAASRVAELATDALGSAYADRDHLARAMAAAAAAVSKHLSGDYGSARDGLDAAIAAADASPSRAAHRFPLHYHRGLLALDADSSGEVDDAIRRGRKISEELGTLGAVPLYHWLAGLRLFWTGQWDEAVVELDGGLAVAESVGTRNGVVLAHSLKALVAVHRGDVAQARAKLGDAEAEHARTGAQYRHHWALLARAQVAGAAGDGGHALAAVTTAWDACQAAGAKSELAVVGPELARLAAAAGDATTPGRVAASLGALSATNSWVASLAGAALLCRGLADDDPEALCEAVVAYQRSGRVLDTALAAEDAGVALGRTGRLDAAMSVLDQAWNAYDGLGSWRGRARVDARYRALGLRRGPRGMRPRARTGWDALTETERRIASLVAEGCSNPQIAERLFVSRGTVKSHVSHVLAKIGVRSRVELAVEAARRAPPSR